MEENSSQSNKYDAALAKYNTNLSDADIQARVADLIEKKVPENNIVSFQTLKILCNSCLLVYVVFYFPNFPLLFETVNALEIYHFNFRYNFIS